MLTQESKRSDRHGTSGPQTIDNARVYGGFGFGEDVFHDDTFPLCTISKGPTTVGTPTAI